MEGLDETIAPLIEAMNRVSFIETLSSCGGHPEESAVREYGYAVGTVVFEVEDEPENAIRWYGMMQDILTRRKAETLERARAAGSTAGGAGWTRCAGAGAFIFAKKFGLNPDGYLCWQWDLKIQATGKTPDECRRGLGEGIAFLTVFFREIAE